MPGWSTWTSPVYLAGVTINGVEVSGYVEQQLDERHPERRLLRRTDLAGMRLAWAAVVELADSTLNGPAASPRSASTSPSTTSGRTSQTLRHLVYATDRWITRTGARGGRAVPSARHAQPAARRAPARCVSRWMLAPASTRSSPCEPSG